MKRIIRLLTFILILTLLFTGCSADLNAYSDQLSSMMDEYAEQVDSMMDEYAEMLPSTPSAEPTEAPQPEENKYPVQIDLDCEENIMFSTYDVDVYVDDVLIGMLEHGSAQTYDTELSEGDHTLKLTEEGSIDICGVAEFSVTSKTLLKCELSCHYDEVQIESFSAEPIIEEAPVESAQAEPAPTETVLPEDSSFSVHFIDVGQADAALIECDGHYMLIDGGNKGDSDVIYTVLKNANVKHLDLVVGTHAHEDHIGGIPGAFNYATADLTLCPVTDYDSDAFDDFARYASENGGGITVPSVGDKYTLGSAAITILGVNGGSDTNDTSIVLKIQYGETAFLFAGDAEREAEQAILNTGADLSATVLKVGHHGSDTSTTYPFLREIMPAHAIISVGADNSYDHPTDDALSRLRDADAEIYRTDLHGDIFLSSDGKTVSISTERTASNEDVLTPGGTIISEPTPTPEPEPEPEPTEEPSEEPSDQMCWKSATGSKYHSINDCGRMNPNKAKQITVAQAEKMGLEPCAKCWY